MIKFTTRVVDEIKAREVVEQLCIYGVGQLDLLEEQLVRTTYSGEFRGLISFIQHFANGGNPGRKVKYLRGNDGTTEFEFISKHLRIYAIQRPARKLIIYGGLKKAADSRDNIKIFRAIKSEYLFFVKQKK
jgi:hypothetical protein